MFSRSWFITTTLVKHIRNHDQSMMIRLNRFHFGTRLRNEISKQDNNELIEFSQKLDSTPKINALDKVNSDNIEFLNEISPSLKKSFNLAAYVNSSETLQQLIKLNVDLSKIEKDDSLASFIVRCDFKADIEPLILLLIDNGVDINDVGEVLTKNPYLITMRPSDLELRINYFSFRKFNKDDIGTILLKGPKVFNLKLQTVDARLADLSKEYSLSPQEIRHVVKKHPNIILLDQLLIKACTFVFNEEMGFQPKEIKSIILRYPMLWSKLSNKYGSKYRVIMLTFEYVHITMKISHEQILKFPLILTRRVSKIQERHLYLEKLGRAQYDPTKPLYVPLNAFYSIDDSEFCLKYAKTSVMDFNEFVKSL